MPKTKKRRPLIASLLSLICPGLGQLYATQPGRGTRLLGGAAVLGALLLATLTAPPSPMLVIAAAGLLAGLIVYQFGVAVDAYRVARRAGAVALTRVNRVWIYLVILVAWCLVPELARPLVRWSTYKIPAASMIPTLMVGDYLVARRGAFADRPPQAGDLVVFKLPRDNTTDFVKRIVGLPGQRIQMRDGRLHIDDVVVPRERVRELAADPARDLRSPVVEYLETLPNGARYRIFEISDTGPYDDTPVLTVPADHVFVLGDNRDNSLDSRALTGSIAVGFVPFANLRDQPSVIFWSRDLDRLGLTLR
jgi:signal peptidase I